MKQIKRLLLVFLALLFPLFAYAVAVGDVYTQEKLDGLNKTGKPALVFIYADWCPTCKAQGKILNELLPEKEFSGITTLNVDFDMQKPVVRGLNAKFQSTLIVFKGGKEVGRVTAETSRDRIAELLRKAL